MSEPFLTRYLQPLLAGRRAECFELMQDALVEGHSATALLCETVWPAMQQIERLYRDHRIERVTENMAVRINRALASQLQASLPRVPANNKRVVVVGAGEDREEVGAQILTDLLGADGWDVLLIGGNVPYDEVLNLVGQARPQVLLVYGTLPAGMPDVRKLITIIREIGVCPTMNIVVCGGVFDRADGLWQEVGADMYASEPLEIVTTLREMAPRKPGAVSLGVVKKRRRRRKAHEATAELAKNAAAQLQ